MIFSVLGARKYMVGEKGTTRVTCDANRQQLAE